MIKGHRRSWKVDECYGRSRKGRVSIYLFYVWGGWMVIFIWPVRLLCQHQALSSRLWTWIWDLGLGLGLDKSFFTGKMSRVGLKRSHTHRIVS